MKITSWAPLTLLILLLCGCSLSQSGSHPQAWLKPGARVALPAPVLSAPLSQQQLLTATVDGKAQSLMVMLDADGQKITLAALSPIGIRLFKVTYDAEGIHTEQSVALGQLPPAEQVLSDIMMSYWPIADWAPNLPKGWSLVERGDQRLLLDSQGETVSEILYHSEGGKRQPVAIIHHGFGYQIQIQNMDTAS
ncbi:Protein of uncharacterised function (DUF3261) [Leminorella richardii]|uniref:Protein of uncharacterized function (DUF3261) n=1 Tax=Leminorella richardii TaxID=158841 RepID=A0A2X4UX58_9GAMM|nr:DUF3261 domain-containing protein [Leminorella richardii]SQI44447.1 Protein of uncharacterised function (DUF3261) [Leminorella richardii]